jgi:hypothetical protein
MPQVTALEIESMPLHIAKHFFNPHAPPIQPDGCPTIQLIGRHIPGFGLARLPEQQQIGQASHNHPGWIAVNRYASYYTGGEWGRIASGFSRLVVFRSLTLLENCPLSYPFLSLICSVSGGENNYRSSHLFCTWCILNSHRKALYQPRGVKK